MMEIILVLIAVLLASGLYFCIMAFYNAYVEKKITVNVIDKFIIGCCLFALSSTLVFVVFGIKTCLAITVLMALSVLFLLIIYPKVKESNS